MWGLFVASVLAGAPASPLDRYRTPPVPVQVGDPFAWAAEPVSAVVGRPTTAKLRLVVPPGYRVYRDQVEVVGVGVAGLVVGAASLPPGKLIDDGEGGVREGFDADVTVSVPITASRAGSLPLRFDVRHQGCRTGLCYPSVASSVSTTVAAAVK